MLVKMATVCNVKVSYIRPKYQNLKEWMEDPQNVYCARKGIIFIDKERFPKKDSAWANPFKISPSVDRDTSIAMYEHYIREKLRDSQTLRDELESLRGKNLGCWCVEPSSSSSSSSSSSKNVKCHCDVLVKILNETV
jgi:hypothetical protein